MIKNIMFGTDGSPYGAVAGEYAFDFADRLDARLEAVHVVDTRRLEPAPVSHPAGYLGWMPPGLNDQLHKILTERGQAILRAVGEEGERRGFPVETTLEFGVPSQVFEELQSRTELLVLGRRGEHAAMGGDYPGSTMDRYVRRASRCCMVTPAKFARVEKILIAVDGSPSAARALQEAAELANGLKAPLVILAVADRDSGLPDAEATVRTAHSIVRAHDCAAAALTATGSPTLRILEMAAATGCGLVVLGMHGHGWIYDRMIGSVAANLVARSEIPVMLVR